MQSFGEKYADTFFGGANSGKFLFENLTPFEKFLSSGEEETRLGGGIIHMHPANHVDCISLVYGNIMHYVAGPRTTVTLIILRLK